MQQDVLCNIPRVEHITPTLTQLHWLPVKSRIEFKILLITFKVIHGLTSDYLSELTTNGTPSRYHLRSNDEILLVPPKLKTLKTLGDSAFAVDAHKL